MNFIKNKKNHLGIVLYKYSFVFTILFSIIFSTFIYNQVTSAEILYWGNPVNENRISPCGYIDGENYLINGKILSAEAACNSKIIQGIGVSPTCFKSKDHYCGPLDSVPQPIVPGDGTDNNPQEPGNGTDRGVSINNKLINPIGPNLDTLEDFIVKIIEIALYVIVPILSLMIIYTGFLFVSAQGNSEKLTTAKKALAFTLIGAALILGAFVITEAIKSTVEVINSNT
jgi:hypothetical protein